MNFESGSFSDKGRVRTSNQDAVLAVDGLFAVADGMGGHAGGEVASTLAIDVLRNGLAAGSMRSGFSDLFAKANEKILEAGKGSEKLKGMGTTLTAALFTNARGRDVILLQNVGDSRAYLMRGTEIIQITDDHTYVQELVKAGSISEEEARSHAQRHILTRALGVERGVLVDSFEVTPEPGDVLMICSDGLTNHLTDEEIGAYLSADRDAGSIAHSLVDAANANGGSDNTSVVVIRIIDVQSSDFDRMRRVQRESVKVVGAPAHEAVDVVRVNPVMRGTDFSAMPSPIRRGEATKGPGLLTVRTGLFVLILAVVLGVSAFAVGLYANHSYFVGVRSGKVAIFRGRPGGLLWYKPTLVEVTSLSTTALNQVELGAISSDVTEPSLPAARTYVVNLRGQLAASGTAGSHATTTTVAGG